MISHFFTFPKPTIMDNMDDNEFEDVMKNDVKTSWGFFLFMGLWLCLSGLWLVEGGAQDGAGWVFAIGVAILIINAVMKWRTRNEGKQ
jgi:uncharacterized membrane protein HdeD (DUF308 family)